MCKCGLKYKDQATPRPWSAEMTCEHKDGGTFSAWIRSGKGDDVINRLGKIEGLTEQEVESNARLIVKAVNCHDELIEALKTIKDINQKAINNHGFSNTKGIWFDYIQVINKVEAALAKAGKV